MINNNRIVPVTKTDLISLYGLILKQNSSYGSLAKLASLDIEGNYKVTTNSAIVICDQPAVSIDFDATASSVSAGTVFFVADNGFKGVAIDGTIVDPADGSDDVVADGSLYSAALATGAVTISKVGF